MTKKKASDKTTKDSKPEPVVLQKANQPLVFISHDTRDADLAEEFSTLLKNASAGGLKSFRSSDKKGTQGIEYGLDWYPTIMDKIAEASEVVCLLTKRSVEKPWILYEAGVAKGKLDKKVIGIAMGIQTRIAFTGPFAQFQNNDGSSDAIKKLVLDLVRKVPGLDPDPDLVGQLVDAFHKKATELIEKTDKQPAKSERATNEDIVAKLFEEVKIMFESLSSRIESRAEPDFRRRKRRFHPMMFEELNFVMGKENPYLGLLMMASFFKDDLPWFYELGMQTYRDLKAAETTSEKEIIILNFRNAFEMLDHPMMREFYGDSNENHFPIRESHDVFGRTLDRLLREKK